MNKLKKYLLLLFTLPAFLKVGNVFGAFGIDKIIPGLKDTNTIDVSVQNWIVYLFWFLFLVATIYWLYWWFLIFTAADDDDKVKKWKTAIVQALIWIVIIFLAGPLVEFFIWADWVLQNTWE